METPGRQRGGGRGGDRRRMRQLDQWNPPRSKRARPSSSSATAGGKKEDQRNADAAVALAAMDWRAIATAALDDATAAFEVLHKAARQVGLSPPVVLRSQIYAVMHRRDRSEIDDELRGAIRESGIRPLFLDGHSNVIGYLREADYLEIMRHSLEGRMADECAQTFPSQWKSPSITEEDIRAVLAGKWDTEEWISSMIRAQLLIRSTLPNSKEYRLTCKGLGLVASALRRGHKQVVREMEDGHSVDDYRWGGPRAG